MPRNLSFNIWVVSECGYEHQTPLQAFTLKWRAQELRDRMAATKPESEYGEPLSYDLQPLALVVHDGCHTLTTATALEGGKKS